MALSNQEKHNVVRYLGWPGKVLVEGSIAYNTQVVDRVSDVSVEMEDEARRLLERIALLDEKLEKALCRVGAKKVGDIELNSAEELRLLRKERGRLIMELSDLLEIPYVGSSGMMMQVCV